MMNTEAQKDNTGGIDRNVWAWRQTRGATKSCQIITYHNASTRKLINLCVGKLKCGWSPAECAHEFLSDLILIELDLTKVCVDRERRSRNLSRSRFGETGRNTVHP